MTISSVSHFRRAFTLLEVIVSVVVFSLVSLVVFEFTRWVNMTQEVTNWKQSAMNAVRLNEVFWEKYFTGATGKINNLVVDSHGVILVPPVIATEPLKIRNAGTGELLTGFTGNETEWPLWQFKTFRKHNTDNTFDEFLVTGFLSGKAPNINLVGRVTSGGKTVVEQQLLFNLTSIKSSVREYTDEHVMVIALEFTLQYPRKPEIVARGSSQFKISTTIESL
ncbi:MAG: prepilin-type N-terminal cleavage/methylation domain-containing protein [Candidatus Riflebacteria bacterium]|nr:prepilin-type N-terminal cleavage/methylation domain-containing protein [Candidatus Riflebacteria bacterium]